MKTGNHVYSVSEVSNFIDNMFRQEFFLQNLSVRGEISGISQSSRGHLYFDLKDERCLIKVAAFNFSRRGDLLALKLKNGDRVVVTGSVTVYTKGSNYSLKLSSIALDGEGEMYRKYLEIQEKLRESGMFDPMYKKPLPGFVRKIAVVTSPTGRAIGDITRAVSQRNPYVQVLLVPASVQGEDAVPEIVEGIRAADRLGADIIIVGRGGGSMEDLFIYNSEEIANAIFACRTPVVSAVGHEDDRFISDEVADHRSPTPSLAVTDTVFDIREFDAALESYLADMENLVRTNIAAKKEKTRALEERLQTLSPARQLREKRERLSREEERLRGIMRVILQRKKMQLGVLAERLEGKSPLHMMRNGYSFVSGSDGRGVSSVDDIGEGDSLTLHMKDGRVNVTVEDIVHE
ncbi:MAG: exodeoxyribonuclease VII large subunit [Eubacterium sp.]|nr:exodeoxyribonuclease VII large subunit [Eubacterium sp.]